MQRAVVEPDQAFLFYSYGATAIGLRLKQVLFVRINWLKKPHFEWDESFTFVEEKAPSKLEEG